MEDSSLNHLMILHVHKDRTDALTLVDVANDFIGGEKETENNCLANFPRTISQTSSLFSSKSTQMQNLRQNKRYCTKL